MYQYVVQVSGIFLPAGGLLPSLCDDRRAFERVSNKSLSCCVHFSQR